KASTYQNGGEIFQIASGNELTIEDLTKELKIIFEKLGYKMKIKFGDKRMGDVLRNFSDTRKANNYLGWQPKNDINKGLKETINSFLSLIDNVK
ncbi:MAG: epimerase, partial [Candidatus Marinimicrobia bacterium]|nr:epimerase [Candidatus Neomarinimicrobiota bacterium]